MNKLLPASILLSALATCGGCHWNSSQFLGRYQLDGTGDHRYLVDTRHNEIVVNEQVLDVNTREHYVLVLREPAQSYECGPSSQKTILTDYSGQLEYWVLDAGSGEKVGPLDSDGYAAFLKSHSLPNVELKQASYYVPAIAQSQAGKPCVPI